MKVAIYPGSFDPITSGHLNIIQRASKIFDRLIVCVMVNAGKSPMFTLEERVDMIRRVVDELGNVEVDASDELLAEYAKRKGSCVIVKGLRAMSDFEREFQMSIINHKLNPGLDTMFLTADSEYMYMSLTDKLHMLSPLNVLKRGYSVLYDKDMNTVTSAKEIEEGGRYVLQLKDGQAEMLAGKVEM